MLLKIHEISPEGMELGKRIPAGALSLGTQMALEGDLEVQWAKLALLRKKHPPGLTQ